MKKATKAAIERHGLAVCVEAVQLCDVEGEGASTVATYLGLKGTRTADAAINAGREALKNLKPILDDSGVRTGEEGEAVLRLSGIRTVVKVLEFCHPWIVHHRQPFEITSGTRVMVGFQDGRTATVTVGDLYTIAE